MASPHRVRTFAYGYPTASAAGIALATVASCAPGLNFNEVRFALFSEALYQHARIYQHALTHIAPRETDGS